MSKIASQKGNKTLEMRNSHTDDIYSNCIRSYLEENRSLKDAIKALSSELRKQKQINSQLTDQISANQQETINSRKQMNQMKKKNEELSKANEELLREANSRISELNEELQESRREVIELKQEITRLKNSHQQMILAHEDYAARLDQSEVELRRAKEQLNTSKDHIDRLSHMNADKEAQLAELSATCSSYDQKVRSLSTQLAFNDDRYNEQSSLISNLKQRISFLEDLQHEVPGDGDQFIQIQQALRKSEDRCQELTDALHHSQMKLYDMPINDKEIQTLRDEHSVLLKRAEDAEDCARQYEKELSDKSKQYTETINKQNENIASLTAKLRQTQQEKDEYQSMAQKLENQYHDLEQTVQNLSSKVSSLIMNQPSPKRVSFPDTEINLSPTK